MAKIERDEYVTVQPDGTVKANYNWRGIGIAYVPDTWLMSRDVNGHGQTIFLGELRLRIIRYERFPGGGRVVKDNWRWPIWWALLRLWLFLCWLERNLRLTAAIWGLLKGEMACIPRWRDFLPLWYLRKWRNDR